MIPIVNFVLASAVARQANLPGPEVTRIAMLASVVPLPLPISLIVARVAADSAAAAHAAAEAPPPTGLRIVARFGTIATARIQRLAVRRVWEDPAVISLKAPRWYATEYGPVLDPDDAENIDVTDTDQRRPDGLAETGRGTVIAV